MNQPLASVGKENQDPRRLEVSHIKEHVSSKAYCGPPCGNVWPISYGSRDLAASLSSLVGLYAKLGLTCHNMFKATNWKLYSLEKVIATGQFCYYYDITLRAYMQSSDLQSQQLFHVEASENKFGKLDIVCSVATTPDTPNKSFMPQNIQDELPEWPTETAFNDGKRFYKLEQRDLCTDWICQYLQLVVCARDRCIDTDDVNLVPVEVVIETTEPSESIVYITFKDYRNPELALQKAIVRRIFIENEYLSLKGEIWTGTKPLTAEERYYLKYPEMR